MQPSLQDINDKLDQLLKYQKRQRIWGWIKSIWWLIIFVVFVGLPTYFAMDVFKNPGKYIDLKKIQQYQKQFEQFQKQAQQFISPSK
jgi:hypothetical protein